MTEEIRADAELGECDVNTMLSSFTPEDDQDIINSLRRLGFLNSQEVDRKCVRDSLLMLEQELYVLRKKNEVKQCQQISNSMEWRLYRNNIQGSVNTGTNPKQFFPNNSVSSQTEHDTVGTLNSSTKLTASIVGPRVIPVVTFSSTSTSYMKNLSIPTMENDFPPTQAQNIGLSSSVNWPSVKSSMTHHINFHPTVTPHYGFTSEINKLATSINEVCSLH